MFNGKSLFGTTRLAGGFRENSSFVGVLYTKKYPQLAVHDIKVINARDKFFIVMPSRKNPDETFRDIVHPINSQFRGVLEKAVIEAYNQALADAAAESSRTREELALYERPDGDASGEEEE